MREIIFLKSHVFLAMEACRRLSLPGGRSQPSSGGYSSTSAIGCQHRQKIFNFDVAAHRLCSGDRDFR
jgi:hypothetical protein